MKFIVLAIAALSLTGCINTAPSENQLATNAKQCEGFGYKPGTDRYADCQLSLAQQTAEQNENRRARMNAGFRAMSMAGAASQPRQTTCNQFGNSINCTSY
jgi:hypothetical protein